MSWISLCAVLFAAFCVSYGCVPDDDVFVVKLENVTVQEGTDTSFVCKAHPNLTGFGYGWGYTLFGETSETVFDLANNPFNLNQSDGNVGSTLHLPSVSPDLNGARFRCSIKDRTVVTSLRDQVCSMPNQGASIYTSAFIYVEAPPMISNLEMSYSVATLDSITIQATISSNPKPTVTLYRVAPDGAETILSGDSQPRVSISDTMGNQYGVTFSDVRRSDQGSYRIVVRNGILPNANQTFSLAVTGVDPPEVTVSPGQVVESYDEDVTLLCEVQRDGYNSSTIIEWMDPASNVVMSVSGEVQVQDHSNGTVSLTFKLTAQRTGTYSCTASNGHSTDTKSMTVFGPPPSPASADIETVDTTSPSVTIRWRRPQQSTIITQYKVTIYSESGKMEKLTEVYPEDHSVGSITLNLDPGEYEFTVTALSGRVEGTESTRRPLLVDAPFPMAIVIGAAVGGFVVIVILVVLAIGVFYCCCKCCIHGKENSSHHQEWNSDEDKVPHHSHTPAIMNSYTTALALNSHSDLPPSPMSPMTSTMGIDPKWEFPRENITLQDELAVGQFTVLYKATAKGISRDNRLCEVTVKSLIEGATDDDLKVLIYEVDMLATIEEHPNIVSLLRVCSVGKPLYMVMEYMCHGDLLGFLRSCRGHRGMYAVSPGPRYQPPALQLCSRDLLNMATKIASGMRFLADRKVVHRALCAKNILVGAGMDVKIYNVGAFDSPIDTGDDLTKWMAPETLFDQTNTTYSDVWSFGVTLWELVTVGGTPYADVPADELYARLQNGMRMACPPHCAQEVYDIMIACWQKNPVDRPHFAIIHENLDELVTSKVSYLDFGNYDSQAYSHFGKTLPKSTPL